MLLDVIDRKIRRAFSDAALEYDLLTSLHKEIGRELVRKVGAHSSAPLQEQDNETILDIGMGTGWLTGKLKFYFPESQVVGIDFAEGMLDVAKEQHEGFEMLQANALRLPFKADTFDLVVSNLSLQWIKSLNVCFEQCKKTLKKNGYIYVTLFGYETFTELFESLEKARQIKKREGSLKVQRLPSMEMVEAALQKAQLRNVQLKKEIIKVHFKDMFRLIKWIKSIGANGLPKQMFIGKEMLSLANDHYERFFKDKFGIYATFEVIWAQAQK